MGKAPEYWDMVTEGLADIALFACGYNPARFQMSAVAELPFFSTSSRTSYDVAQALLAKNLIAREFEPNKLLLPIMTPPAQIFTNKKITKIEDFKGARFFGAGPVWSRTWGLLGAQMVSIGMQDVYLALERGTLDGAANNWASVMSYRWVEVVKYPIEINLMGGWFTFLTMNSKSWSKLSPEVQAAWTKICEKYGARCAALFDGVESTAKKVWTDAGKTIEPFPAAEKEKLGAVLAPVWQDWIDRMEKAGKPGKEIYKTYVEVLKKKGEPVVMKVPGLYQD
jgi:TRAP-type C4-dicarboxylate transport system substrate-binding protein